MAALSAGYPGSAAFSAVNRQCPSGLTTCANIASAIAAGYIDIGIGKRVSPRFLKSKWFADFPSGAGVESMSMYYGPGAMPTNLSPAIFNYSPAADVREEQDKFALRSHNLVAKARQEDLFDEEIVPVTLPNGTVVRKDDGIRPTTLENLTKLRPAFGKNGATTAGNASQMTDGAARVFLMRRSTAEKLGYRPLARWLGFSVLGVPPRIMGIGPEKAIPAVLKQVALSQSEALIPRSTFPIEETGIVSLISIAIYIALNTIPYIERCFKTRHSNERREEIEVAFQDVRPGRVSRMGTVAKVAGGGEDVFRVGNVRRLAERRGSGDGDGGDEDAIERREGRMSSPEPGFRPESSLHPLVQVRLVYYPLAVPSTPTWFVTSTPSTRPEREEMLVGSSQDLPLLPISPHPIETSPRFFSLFDNDTLKRLMSCSGQQAVEGVRKKQEEDGEDGLAPVGSGQDVIGIAKMSLANGEKTLDL
ncbi:3-ketoacyl-CoA thiolase, peroxisomal [Rhizophlyctis rosea]|nr:3-ketoacyl-CoA thiolase, peroxisomal [Rhizophlyctis rosea]